MGSIPSDSVLEQKIRDLIPTIDLQETGIKKFIRILSEEFDVDLKSRKDFITKAVTQAIISSQERNDDDEDEESEEEEEEEIQVPKKKTASKPKKESEKRKNGAATGTGSGGGTGLAVRKEISRKLSDFLGQGDTMSRTEIVKLLWEYIREHNLQNPNNKREILLDDKMKEVFECDTFTMFTMNKYIGAHIHPFKPVDLTTNTTKPKPTKRKNVKGKKGEKKKRKTGSQPPYRLSNELQAVVNEPILPRPQVVSKIWAYIKSNNLQNEKNKREILCDQKLKAIMNKNKVTMFEMNTLISRHLIEKVDRSEYQHKDEEDEIEEEEEEQEEDEQEDEQSDEDSYE